MLTIICVGKIKEAYLKEGIEEYRKRLSRFTKIRIIEIPDENCDVDGTAAATEGKKILLKIKERDYVIGLDSGGTMYDSETFAKKIDNLFVSGHSNLCFLVGGSVGLSDAVKNQCDLVLSFSALTFPHQLFRLILLEQLYRCFKINANEIYHK